MLRKSNRPYTDRSVRPPARARIEERLSQRALIKAVTLVQDLAEARPCTDGDELYGPESDDQKCTEEGELPGSLTEHDLLLLHDQARLQHSDSPEEIQGLTDAWNAAKAAVHRAPEALNDPEGAENLALSLATMIDPRNAKGYRTVPVTFGPGKPPALDPELVPRAMSQLFGAYASQALEPDEWYHEFEKIHPLEDGNGRLGDLMWKMDHVRRGLPWPTSHPPDFFGTDQSDYTKEV